MNSYLVNKTIIQIYAAPTCNYADEQFYEKLEYTITSSHEKDICIVQCDWNAVIGDSSNELKNVVGKFTLEKTNSRGIILYECTTN